MRAHRYAIAAVVVVLLAAFAAYAEEPVKRSAGQYIDDKAVSSKVKASLIGDPSIKGHQIEVETFDGIVQLSGFVDNSEQIVRAEELAKGVEGVKSVKNNLIVRSRPGQ